MTRAPASDEEAGEGDPAPGEPEHGDRPVAERAAADGRHREVVGIDGRSVVGVVIAVTQPLIEARNRVTPSSAGEDPDDPEPERDLLLVPAGQLEVVVERAHPEEPLAAASA